MPITGCSSCAAASGCASATTNVEVAPIEVPRQPGELVVALAGNPNTGKSTVFNALTGLRQHTGNWPGKTVARAQGQFEYHDQTYHLVDLPGTYSLLATSVDEEIARDFLLFGKPDVAVIVVDATRLERNLNLVLQVLEITDRAVVCLNLMDEAKRHSLNIDCDLLSEKLGVPVVSTSARFNRGLDKLRELIEQVASGKITCRPHRISGGEGSYAETIRQLEQAVRSSFPSLPNARWVALRLLDGDTRVVHAVQHGELGDVSTNDSALPDDPLAVIDDDTNDVGGLLSLASNLRWEVGPDYHEQLVERVYGEAARIADACVTLEGLDHASTWDSRLDRLFTGPWTAFPIMMLMLAVVLWLTIIGANYPSSALAWLLMDNVHPLLKSAATSIGVPWWMSGLLIDGIYLATAWVVSVMLPPMAIFFPLFTLLEDFGYLPRVAFNLDSLFRRCGAHGKQALTMSMGLGCNAAGVIAARVIDSPRERLIAIITNNFSLCNGRWPTQILIATVFIGALVPSYLAGLVSAFAVLTIAMLGFALTFIVSWSLSRTVLRGEPSLFSLELPPYRPPRIMQTLYTSLIDRTLFVLWRAVVFAVPAGAAIWLVANVHFGGASLADHIVKALDPLGLLIGLNGVILLAYVVAIPANEIVIPTVMMLTVLIAGVSGVGEQGAGVMFESDDAGLIRTVLGAGGWSLLTAVNLMLFSLIHNPCSTTIYTIWKETRSIKWTALSTLLPLAMGFVICFCVAQVWRLVA